MCGTALVMFGHVQYLASNSRCGCEQVYKGTRGAEPVAIKVVTGQNDRAVKDFRREVQTLMSLHCTYIVQFLGACITVCTRASVSVAYMCL